MREVGDGETVIGCDRQGCPDCITREYVRRMKRGGNTVMRAVIEHWPVDTFVPDGGKPYRNGEVVSDDEVTVLPADTGRLLPGGRETAGPIDNLLTGKRTGSF